MTKISSKKRGGNARIWLFLLGFIIFVITAMLILGWSKRQSLAQRSMVVWCLDKGLECKGEFTKFDFGSVRLEGLSVRSQGQVPFEAESVELALNWPSFRRAEVSSIQVLSPTVRGALVDGGLELYGLEDLIPESNTSEETSQGQTPELDIQNGQLILATDAGDISGTFQVKGKPLAYGTANLQISPNSLRRDNAEITWSAGDIALVFQEGAIVGDINFAIETAQLDGLGLSDASFNGKLAEEEDQVAFEMNAHAAQVFASDMKGENIILQASGGLARLEGFDLDSVLKALGAMTVTAEGENISAGDVQMTHIELSGDMKETESGLNGPIAIDVRGLRQAQSSIGHLVIAGETAMRLEEDAGYRYKGSVILHEVKLAAQDRRRLLASLHFPEPFSAHGTQLRNGISQALADFELGLDIDATYREDYWSVLADRPTLLQAASGMMLSINPPAHQPWFRATPEKVNISGDISLAGGRGLPKLTGTLAEMSVAAADIILALKNVSLAPWAAAGRTLSGKMEYLEVGVGDKARLVANGEVSLSGVLPGLDLKPTRIIGHVSAMEAVEGWRVQTHENSCVGFATEGMGAGTLQFEEMTLSLCPVDGRFVRQENGQSVGRIDLGDLSLPFLTGDSTGTLGIENAGLEWFAGDGVRLFLKGRKFALPLQFPEDTLSINGDEAEISFELGGGPVQIKASLGTTVFGGTMIPANVASESFSFTGITTEAGIDGEMRAGHVRIADINQEPVYQPLIAELKATMHDGIVALEGPIRSEARGLVIANADMDLHLADFAGEAHVTMEPLSFAIGGLQPVHLSELMRDVLINARGGLTGGADFLIQDGALSGTGRVVLSDLIFDTLTVGTVSGVNGQIEFSDILGLTTPPSQKLTIEEMDPGFPLENGEILFQLVDGTSTKLESAVWPFAGGRLEIMPVTFVDGALEERVTMQARELELEQLLEVLEVPDLVATGTVSGEFPIDIDGANIMLRNAVLTADEKGGRISYTGTATDVAKGQNEYADYAFDALKDFDFQVMRIIADGNLIGRIILTVDLLGKSDGVLGGASFDFGISIDSHLSQLLRTGSEAASKSYVSEYYKLREQQEGAIDE